MSDQTSQEPTMEEILASIRRIISEDDAPAEEPKAEAAEPEPAPAAEAPAPGPEPEPEPEPAPEPTFSAEPEDEEVLELTDRVDQVGDLDVYSPTTAPASAEPESAAYAPEPAASYDDTDEGLLSQTAATAAASAFGQLSAAIGMPHSDRTLEDVVRELLRPLLKQWLDDNLPRIVEASVREEVERIARGRVR
ncbi:MAG: pole-organizing protein PopZ [Phenylobacterium sp. RIFCSPHIGHO2_01_FULL_70_10]|nr:MAG: pole-organizing protein PopZ [Phenylobacterium sp. RIFCSPHIGHO2_01_FULL_70_10]